jgi:hypothetical protein
VTSGATEYARGTDIEQFRGAHFLGDGGVDIPVPPAGRWGWRVYTRLQDGEAPGEPNQPFPDTQHWMSADAAVFERYRDSSGAYTDTGEGDTAGFWFSFRSTDPGPLGQPPFPADTNEHNSPA